MNHIPSLDGGWLSYWVDGCTGGFSSGAQLYIITPVCYTWLSPLHGISNHHSPPNKSLALCRICLLWVAMSNRTPPSSPFLLSGLPFRPGALSHIPVASVTGHPNFLLIPGGHLGQICGSGRALQSMYSRRHLNRRPERRASASCGIKNVKSTFKMFKWHCIFKSKWNPSFCICFFF